MKKIISLISAAAMLTPIVSVTSTAEYDPKYVPSLYFTVPRNSSYQMLTDGSIYINKNDLNGQDVKVNAEVYIEDEQKKTAHVIAKWHSESEYIALSDLKTSIDLCGKAPYSKYTASNQIITNESTEDNSQAVSYSDMDAMALTGEKSDDYPLAGFTITISKDIPIGTYSVDFMSGEYGNQCDILYSFGLLEPVKEFFPSGNQAKPLKIVVSDLELGNVNADDMVDAADATDILAAATQSSAGHDNGLTTEQILAADIDGDGIPTAQDATLVLAYATYRSGGGKKSITDYYYIEK